MAFQQQVFRKYGLGVPGEVYNNGPLRAQTFTISSTDAANNVVGRAFTIAAEGQVQAGNPSGSAVLAGILVNPKAYALYGDVGSPTLTLPNEVIGEFAMMGSFVVSLPNTANIGDEVIYDNDTGLLESMTRGSALPAGKSYLGANVDYYNVESAGLAVITLTPIPIPFPASEANAYVDRNGDTYVDRNGDTYVEREEESTLSAAQQKKGASNKKGNKVENKANEVLDGPQDDKKGAK